MSALAVILVVLGGLVLVLFVGGVIVAERRRHRLAADLERQLEEANEALAQAHALDKGWERAGLEAAVREAFAAGSGAPIRELQLIQVVDHPGTDDDRAVFRVLTDDGVHQMELSRHGGHWHAV